MKLEYIGEKVFFEEVKDAGHLWVAMGKQKNVFALTEVAPVVGQFGGEVKVDGHDGHAASGSVGPA